MPQRTSATAAVLMPALVLLASTAQAAFIPPIGLPAGAPYQLFFVTSADTNALRGTESYYNTFASQQAAANPLLPITTWTSITSTIDGTPANTNAPWLGLPIYNTQGQLVADISTGGIYSGSVLLSSVEFDQFGGIIQDEITWTGSSVSGDLLNPLGADPGIAQYGLAGFIAPDWLSSFSEPSTHLHHIYALSGTILNDPEPSSIALLIVGMAGLAGAHWRQRRKRQARG